MADAAANAGGTSNEVANQAAKWNQKNPAVRRILADVRELARDPSDQYAAKPVDENMFEWHFVIRGPKGTDFEGGRYHGKILLPAEYPFKPPHIVFLTPNGRWETRTKICLSMSAYHPEDWQPAWGIRTMLEALISFMPSPSDGALGALDCTPEQRKRFAAESLNYTHPLMPQLPEEGSCSSGNRSKEFAEAVSQMRFSAKDSPNPASAAGGDAETATNNNSDASGSVSASPSPAVSTNASSSPVPQQQQQQQQQQSEGLNHEEQQQNQPIQAAVAAPPQEGGGANVVAANNQQQHQQNETLAPDRVDDALKFTSWFVLFAIFILTYRKMLLTFAPEL